MASPDDTRNDRIRALFSDRINPALADHGGWAEFVDLRGDQLVIRLGGGCQGCGMSTVTVKQGILELVRKHFPEVVQIVDDTDHAAGRAPYY